MLQINGLVILKIHFACKWLRAQKRLNKWVMEINTNMQYAVQHTSDGFIFFGN